MKGTMMKRTLLFAISTLLLLATQACQNNPTEPIPKEDENLVQRAADNSEAIFQTMTSAAQVGELLRGQDDILADKNTDIPTPDQSMAFARHLKQVVFSQAVFDQNVLAKTRTSAEDSLIWEIIERNELEGFTESLRIYYNFDTGIACAEVVKFEFDERHDVEYDSAKVLADLNFTLEDESDDILLSLESLKRFKEGHEIVSEWGKFVPDAHAPGTEPEGGVFDQEIIFPASSEIVSKTAHAEVHADESGSFREELTYADGTTSSEAVTFKNDGTGTFAETHRDGTVVTGTFDEAESDGQGGFSKRVTFPAGHDPVSIFESGEFTFDAADSSIHGQFVKEITFLDGSVKRESVEIDEAYKDGVKITTLKIEGSDDGSGMLTIEETPDHKHIVGEWTDPDGIFTKFEADEQTGGPTEFSFEVYASKEAYENGDPPILSGKITFYPDGSGNGTVTENGVEQAITIGS